MTATVAPLAAHLPGALLVLAFVVLVIVAAGAPLGVIAHTVTGPDRNWFPGTCDTCGKPNTDGHPCTPAHHVPYWAHTEERP